MVSCRFVDVPFFTKPVSKSPAPDAVSSELHPFPRYCALDALGFASFASLDGSQEIPR